MLRIATFNIENLDFSESEPSFETRKKILIPQLQRINADILLLQEVHAQKDGDNLELLALKNLISETKYKDFEINSTVNENNELLSQRNLIALSKFELEEVKSIKHEVVNPPEYKISNSEEPAKKVTWERPMLYTKYKLPNGESLHIINVHLKSKNPSNIPGGKKDCFSWKTASAWAEGSFISAMRRVGQALEVRAKVDQIFDEDIDANIIVCGDFNADFDEVPTEAILGRTENTGNADLNPRVLFPLEKSVADSNRFSLYHHGKKNMLDHLVCSRNFLRYYVSTEIHNEQLHDESIAFATDLKFPESDHAPVVANFQI